MRGPNYNAAQATITVTRNGKPVTTMYPERRIYNVQQMPMTEAAIDSGILGDLYVSRGEPVGGDAWVVRAY